MTVTEDHFNPHPHRAVTTPANFTDAVEHQATTRPAQLTAVAGIVMGAVIAIAVVIVAFAPVSLEAKLIVAVLPLTAFSALIYFSARVGLSEARQRAAITWLAGRMRPRSADQDIDPEDRHANVSWPVDMAEAYRLGREAGGDVSASLASDFQIYLATRQREGGDSPVA